LSQNAAHRAGGPALLSTAAAARTAAAAAAAATAAVACQPHVSEAELRSLSSDPTDRFEALVFSG